jgi:hypothetical protein
MSEMLIRIHPLAVAEVVDAGLVLTKVDPDTLGEVAAGEESGLPSPLTQSHLVGCQ